MKSGQRALRAVLGLVLLSAPLRAADETAALAEIDRLWTLRAEGAHGAAAAAAPIEAVITACREEIAARPASLAARWRLMRALYFKGEYATSANDAKKAIFDEGKKVGEEAFALIQKEARSTKGPVELVGAVRGRPDATACFFWSAVDWGKWALVFGKSAAVKQGAASKIRDYAQAVIALDPGYENGGGYRVLGRLHHQTPSVPFFTGWASRSEALKNLRLAVERAPDDFINRLYLAEAMWDYEKKRRPEAREILERLLKETPRPGLLVEERKVQEEAAAALSAWNAS